MDKLDYARLWDLYQSLLTDNKRDVCDMYFNLDLTVSEIAQQKQISRQAVSDCINSCKKQLESYEQSLGFAARSEELEVEIVRVRRENIGILEEIGACIERFANNCDGALAGDIKKILDDHAQKV